MKTISQTTRMSTGSRRRTRGAGAGAGEARRDEYTAIPTHVVLYNDADCGDSDDGSSIHTNSTTCCSGVGGTSAANAVTGVDVSPLLPKRLWEEYDGEERYSSSSSPPSSSSSSSQSPATTSASCVRSSLPAIPKRKSSYTPTLHDDENDADAKATSSQSSSISSSLLRPSRSSTLLHLQQKPNRLTMSARVGNLKRAGTSYRLNQREDMEYEQHGRRRSAPAVSAATAKRFLLAKAGADISCIDRSNIKAMRDAVAAAAAAVAKEDDGDDVEDETVMVNVQTRDRILRTSSMEFVPRSMVL
jgi:hypothetical protein